MRWSLGHAYANVPHYREAFDAAGVKPGALVTLDDLSAFPFTTKDDLRANYPYGMFAVPMDRVRRIHASSGTTGQPTVVGYSDRDLETWSDVVARSIYASGGRPGMRVHVAYGYGLFTGGLGAHYGAERLGCTVIPVSGGQTERQVRLINDFEPDIIMVTPSYMLALLDEFERQGLEPRQSSLRIGIFGAEPWTEDLRAEVEARAGIDAVDIYGLSEVIGPGAANECVETKDGLHVWEDHFYPEIIDPETGEVLPDGDYGELVFTSLTKEAMPIIRYRTRDLTRLLPGTARSMRRIEKITSRPERLAGVSDGSAHDQLGGVRAELVIRGGRVVDPASGLDELADVAVAGGRIVEVGTALGVDATSTVDATGLVVTAGFIDLHSHSNDVAGHRLQALDGCTTLLELEAGLLPVDLAYQHVAAQGRPLNYGFSTSWALARMQVLAGLEPRADLSALLGFIGD